ncbi:Protein of unknown function (DUF295 [Striga hermonthica]|uniref:KIB1-4 beta-propeller domain-containing protein n=1 Tax=Striga hermonthica TaxID=68872 RepID=A0A9N7R466_STRHE|nr:Protein of unknown function (DUF295 [Striga hermonthica]
MTSHTRAHDKHSFCSLSGNWSCTASIANFSGKRVLGSNHGWLAMADPLTDECLLWNPQIAKKILLPPLRKSSRYNRCVLSKPPTEPGCLAAFICSCGFKLSVCVVGAHEFAKQCLRKLPSIIFMVAIGAVHGQIYGVVFSMRDGYRLVTVGLVDGTTIMIAPLTSADGSGLWIPPLPDPRWTGLHPSYLIESPAGAGKLLFLVVKVFLSENYEEENAMVFQVFRVDVERRECVELDRIDGMTIFIASCGNGFCHWSTFAGGSKPNCIYYANKEGRLVYVYDLGDRSTTPLLLCPDAKQLGSTNYWIDLPEVSLEY